MFASLHNHTKFSIHDSLLEPDDLFRKAKEYGYSAVAVTDHGTLAGLWDSLKASRKHGVKLIPGGEFYFVDDVLDQAGVISHIILLSKNEIGYKNLLLLNNAGFDNFIVSFKKVVPRIDWRLLEKYSEGLICLTACGGGILSKDINAKKFELAEEKALKLKKIFGEDFAIEVQPHALRRMSNAYGSYVEQTFTNKKLMELSLKINVPCVVTNDAHYLEQNDYKAHDAWLAISCGHPIRSGARLKYNVNDFYVKTIDEIKNKLARAYNKMFGEEFVNSCIEHSVTLANKCEQPDWIEPKYSNPSGKELPEFPVCDQPDFKDFLLWKNSYADKSLNDDVLYLRYVCFKALQNRISPELKQQYENRINEELEVLEFHGFSSYMLIVSDFIKYAKNNNIRVGYGRGSGGGSLVAYFLDIHQADPIKYDLIFARFHNKHKTDMPDIDIDFASSGRDIIKQYLVDKYGAEHVAHISNIMTMTPKPFAKAVSKIYEYGGDRKTAIQIGNNIAAAIPDPVYSGIKTIKLALEKAPLFIEYSKKYPELAEFGYSFDKKPTAWSTHAAGLVISKRPLAGLVPLRKDKDGNIALEYDKYKAEENGLVKMDLLCLETLDVIDKTNFLVKINKNEVVADPPNFDEYDASVYNLISSGDTLGVFQLGTSVGTIELCKKIKPQNIEDLAIINSLARPSARTIRENFVKTKNGEMEVSIIDSALNRAFGPTFGFGLYEECLMYLAQDVAGWDLHSADKLRKLTKEKGKNPEKVVQWRQEFLDGAKQKGFSSEMAEYIWDEVVDKFQGYGFNKCLYFYEHVDIHSKDGTYLQSKPIQNVNVGEFVRSREEKTGENIFVEVKDIHDNGEVDMVEIELDTGEKIKCTLNHKFRVEETGKQHTLSEIIKENLSIVVTNCGERKYNKDRLELL